ncbi:hypothetical protein [Vulcanisaeta sp. JCM 16159]|uniref:hypothetical protein n=1 Tax=Vulcanisaeta sp. JCM 16159 TaxID=1295371 RepID=UPI0006CF2873|nr:hypothetical protein [Vulcanisaeta sp. JCM 16159]
MLNRVPIRFGLILEFIAEFLYFMLILCPRYFGLIFILPIMLTYLLSSIMMYLGFNEYSLSSGVGSIGAALLMLGSLIILLTHVISMSYLISIIGMGIAFLGDISISLFFWRAAQRGFLVRVGAVLNAIPIITFIGSLLLAIGIDHVEDPG